MFLGVLTMNDYNNNKNRKIFFFSLKPFLKNYSNRILDSADKFPIHTVFLFFWIIFKNFRLLSIFKHFDLEIFLKFLQLLSNFEIPWVFPDSKNPLERRYIYYASCDFVSTLLQQKKLGWCIVFKRKVFCKTQFDLHFRSSIWCCI